MRIQPNLLRAAAGLPGYAGGVSRVLERSQMTQTSTLRGELLVRSDPGTVVEEVSNEAGDKFFIRFARRNRGAISGAQKRMIRK
jgi:hypothetical protein